MEESEKKEMKFVKEMNGYLMIVLVIFMIILFGLAFHADNQGSRLEILTKYSQDLEEQYFNTFPWKPLEELPEGVNVQEDALCWKEYKNEFYTSKKEENCGVQE